MCMYTCNKETTKIIDNLHNSCRSCHLQTLGPASFFAFIFQCPNGTTLKNALKWQIPLRHFDRWLIMFMLS